MEVGGENRVKIGIVIKYEEKIHDFDEASVRSRGLRRWRFRLLVGK